MLAAVGCFAAACLVRICRSLVHFSALMFWLASSRSPACHCGGAAGGKKWRGGSPAAAAGCIPSRGSPGGWLFVLAGETVGLLYRLSSLRFCALTLLSSPLQRGNSWLNWPSPAIRLRSDLYISHELHGALTAAWTDLCALTLDAWTCGNG